MYWRPSMHKTWTLESVLCQHSRCWPSIDSTLVWGFVFVGLDGWPCASLGFGRLPGSSRKLSQRLVSQQTRGAVPVLVKCWASIKDGGPALGQSHLFAGSVWRVPHTLYLYNTTYPENERCLHGATLVLSRRLWRWPGTDVVSCQRLCSLGNFFLSVNFQCSLMLGRHQFNHIYLIIL